MGNEELLREAPMTSLTEGMMKSGSGLCGIDPTKSPKLPTLKSVCFDPTKK